MPRRLWPSLVLTLIFTLPITYLVCISIKFVSSLIRFFLHLLKFSVEPEIIHLALSRKVFIKEAIPELLRGKAHLGK